MPLIKGRVIIVLASTTEKISFNLKLISYLLTCIGLVSCTSSLRTPNGVFERSQQDPALSGNGQKLALIIDQLGRPTVKVRDLRSGKNLRLRHLSRYQPHNSPSLSWNGRYLAVITQRGNRRVAVIEDLLSGKLHFLPLPENKTPYLLSLSPDGGKIALQITSKGKWQVEVFDLSQMLEADKPSGVIRSTNL